MKMIPVTLLVLCGASAVAFADGTLSGRVLNDQPVGRRDEQLGLALGAQQDTTVGSAEHANFRQGRVDRADYLA
jgi:hypothetical protein